MILAFDWSSSTAILVYGPAVLVLLGAGYKVYRWLRPTEPLVSFGHPSENAMPWVWGMGGSDAEWEGQQQRYESARLSSLTVSYIVENQGDSAIRDVTTGVRTRDGEEHRFDAWFVQILEGHTPQDVERARIPEGLHAGMTDKNRTENFLFWVRFRDNAGRRWEASYDPRSRKLGYEKLSRLVSGEG